MNSNLLLKGLEEEVYTGTAEGTIVGMSHRAKAELPGFATEPDCRNAEFTTPPLRDYDELACELMAQRRRLRSWLATQGDYTLIPGSTLSTGDSSVFLISDESNDYYRFIREAYHTRVVTASAHISVGLDDSQTILRASRLLRLEACLFLALTASSPFLDGRATGYHSTRWRQFPQTPAYVPLFEDVGHYQRFVRQSLKDGHMYNVRHLWLSVRPNGTGVPDELNRVELRICDQVSDPRNLTAVAALMEARLWQMLEEPSLDPLEASELPSATRADDLLTICEGNELAVATDSLDAMIRHWRDGRKMPVRDWIQEYYADAMRTATERGFAAHLSPIGHVLASGNTAHRWLRLHRQQHSVAAVIRQAIREMAEAEVEHTARVC